MINLIFFNKSFEKFHIIVYIIKQFIVLEISHFMNIRITQNEEKQINKTL